MKTDSLLYRILVKLGIKARIDCNSIAYLRSRGIQIGENVNVINSTIDFCHGFLISIGNNVTLTGCHILAHDASTHIPLGVSKVGRVVIGNEVFVGQGAIILPNTHIGNRVVIGSGTVVSKDIPDNSIAVGNPVQIIGTYDSFVEKHRRQMQVRPVYHTLWSEKSLEEKQQMCTELSDGIGYDP